MIKKLLKSLMSRKLFLLLVSICYTLSFVALCYVCSYQKQQISNASEYRALVQVNNEAISLSKAKEIASLLKNQKFSGHFIFIIKNFDAVIYDNDTSFLQSASFTTGKQVLVKDSEKGEIGDKIEIDGEEYEIIGYSKSSIITMNNIYNINFISDETKLVGIVYYDKTLPTEELTSTFKKAFENFGDNAIIGASEPISVFDLFVKNQLFLIAMSLLVMAMLIAFIINIYFFQIRRKFVKLCLNCGVRKYNLLIALIIEQGIIMVPMVILGSIIFALVYLVIASSFIAPLGILEFLLLGGIYLCAMIIVIAINFTIKLWRNYA